MKIKVSITVEIDPADWTQAFGVDGAAAIREDVKAYIGDGVSQGGVFGTGEVSLKSVSWK